MYTLTVLGGRPERVPEVPRPDGDRDGSEEMGQSRPVKEPRRRTPHQRTSPVRGGREGSFEETGPPVRTIPG